LKRWRGNVELPEKSLFGWEIYLESGLLWNACATSSALKMRL